MSTKSIKGTRTEQNLLKSFAGESQARNRYTYFASVARDEGYRQIEAIFQETADQEKEHAKRFFKFLEGGELEITAAFLKAAAAGEHCEAEELYPEFADIAEEEGFKTIAAVYRNVAKAEQEHERRYLKLLERVESGKYFEREKEIYWQCRNCGFVVKAKKAPAKCPACDHPQEFFEPMRDNY